MIFNSQSSISNDYLTEGRIRDSLLDLWTKIKIVSESETVLLLAIHQCFTLTVEVIVTQIY